jgi:excisionase family DNA binding protein
MRVLMRLTEASDYLGVSKSTLKRWAIDSLVPCYKTPLGHRRWTKQMLEEIRENMIVNSEEIYGK